MSGSEGNKNGLAVTFDVDWAPDWAVDLCRELCNRYSRPATFFATHPSDILHDIKAQPRLEVGIHPNFLPGSSQGGNERDVLDYCLKIVPNAKSMRTHCLIQSSHLFFLVAHEFPSIQTDVSIFLPLHENLSATDLYYSGKRLTRLPYFWEDDVFAEWPGWAWDVAPVRERRGMKIFDFHPILVALNAADLSGYRKLKASMSGRRLNEVSKSEVAPFVNRGLGALTFLESLLAGEGSFSTVSELTYAFRQR